jgi:hypothetical protein
LTDHYQRTKERRWFDMTKRAKKQTGKVPAIEPDVAGLHDEGAMLTVDEAWNLLGRRKITRQALYLAAQRGDFPSVRLGRRVLIPRQSFLVKFGIAA